MSVPVYDVTDVRFRHPHNSSSERAWVLDGLSFSVTLGEVLGIIGPNGSGKTSLLNILTRLAFPQVGIVRLCGSDLSGWKQDAVARTVALVPQESAPVFPFTVAQMVLMGRFAHHQTHDRFAGLSPFGWESDRDWDVARSAMQIVDVARLAHRPIDAISGGERQRVLIARALTQEPRVLLLDEPTAHLDLHHQVEICRLLRTLNRERGLTIVLVSHDLNVASQFCDRLLLLNHGRIVALGTPDQVLRGETLGAVYGCEVLIDRHPLSGVPRITTPGRTGAELAL